VVCRRIHVHLTPALVAPERLAGAVAVVIDVLRATTTIVHALAAGCSAVRICSDVEEARHLADHLPAGKVLLAGERDSRPLPGFDLGNSPGEFTAARCRDRTLVLTTTNGTRALLHARTAARVLVAAFVNFSAVCEQLMAEQRPVHIVCAGDNGAIALEDALLAGALVDGLWDDAVLNDAAQLTWDGFQAHGRVLADVLDMCAGGERLRALGLGDDIAAAARVDQFVLVPELRHDPTRIEVGAVGIRKRYWRLS
jgi:2-phosphosulfolactate phosphatase